MEFSAKSLDELKAALATQHTGFQNAISAQRKEFQRAMSEQRDDFRHAMGLQHAEMEKRTIRCGRSSAFSASSRRRPIGG
jgi:hypothetical protein